MKRALVGVALLSGAVQVTVVASGCLPFLKQGTTEKALTPEEQERREQAGEADLVKAKKTNTESAYKLVMKRHPDTRAYHAAASAIAAMRVEEAKVALSKDDKYRARELAEEALKTGDGQVQAAAKAVLDQIAQMQIDAVVKAANDALKDGTTPESCAKATESLATALRAEKDPDGLRVKHAQALEPVTSCLRALLDGAGALEGKDGIKAYAAMRKTIEAPATRLAVGAEASQALLASLHEQVTRALQSATQADIKAKKWENAATTIRDWTEGGAATPKQIEAVKQSVREAVSKDLLERGRAALGKPGAEAMLAELERGIKFLGAAAPEEMKTLQSQIAVWIPCNKLKCTAAAKPKLMYTFGVAPLLPITNPSATEGENLPTATKVWVVATAGSQSLVAKDDPGEAKSLGEKLSAARGWVASSFLNAEDTSEWLPVGAALEKARVWLPVGGDGTPYMLGMVQSVSGKEVSVKRTEDSQIVTVKRDVLRVGVLKQGLKVLAYCTDNQAPTPARFEQVVQSPSGQPIARVTCLTADGKDDKSRDEVLGRLRSKVEWLPPRKP
ncbi:MAG: hypothetical protein HY898_12130 [Deltaproteobacteria bacterium]|nr:hypothetical protein [Deltaproteobacteria bacterium]